MSPPGPAGPRGPRDPGDHEPRPGSLRPTNGGTLALCGCLGLVGGWAYRWLVEQTGGVAPLVTWLQVLVLLFFAAALAAVAWTTWRQLQRDSTFLEPHRAVNRLVLAKASALVGALVAGGYAGYALSWLGRGDELADERMVRSGVAALAGVLILLAALTLERACRVRADDPEA